MTVQHHITKKHFTGKIPKQEQGLSMLIALMMGMVLMAGVTGLLLRQLMARKLGASESYQQMAEIAALNGFNRILSELNNDNGTYKGYLLTLNHHEGDPEISGSEEWGWDITNQTNFPYVNHAQISQLPQRHQQTTRETNLLMLSSRKNNQPTRRRQCQHSPAISLEGIHNHGNSDQQWNRRRTVPDRRSCRACG